MLGTTDDTSGTLNGFEMFNCEPGRRQFIALEKCKLRKAHKGQSPGSLHFFSKCAIMCFY